MAATRVSPAGLTLIKEFEGFVGHPYRDVAGVWTIGYGETKGVTQHSSSITEREASVLLRKRVDRDFTPAVVQASSKLGQHQLDALVSFVYNCGTGAVSSSTTIGKDLRADRFNKVADDLLAWSKARINGRVVTVEGLLRRRKEERALFLKQERPFEGYRNDEIAWIREYDKLRKARKNPARREELRVAMTRRRKRIWGNARKYGWDSDHRIARYKSLLARTR